MNKHLITIGLALLASCIVKADPIDQKRAATIASEYAVAGHQMTLVTKSQRTPSMALKLKAAVAKTSPYYIYSRGENKGFVIVSGDDCLPEVLGYTEQGNFDPNNLPPALSDMLAYYANAIEVAQMKGTNFRYDEKKYIQHAAADRQNIAPFVTSHWHQSSPYNDRCPLIKGTNNKALTGCVATAASQILYYWRKDLPNTLQGTTPTYGYGDAPVTESLPKGTPLKWNLMRDQYGNEPAEYKEAVADLVFACGAATWLTYGSSTSGNIEKIPATFSGFFGMNGGWVAYRDSYSQEAWTQLLYNELAQGRPVMYTGVHPNNGGHAVFVHGYQASTDKFYFNFGWGAGNGYDGYYTTTQADGMNGFNGYQSALINAYPKQWNVKADIKAPQHVLANIETTYRITFENNSTLDFSGFYLFAATSKSKPTDLKNAKSSDTETVIPTGTKGCFNLTAKATTASTWYITLTDANLNVLAQIPVETETPEPKLSAKAVTVGGLLQTESYAGNTYTVVANSKAQVTATIHNAADQAFGGTAKLDLYSSEDNGETFTLLKTVSKSNAVVDANGDTDVEFNVSSIETDKLYKVMVSDSWGSLSAKTDVDVAGHQPAYFRLTGSSDLTASLSDGNLVFQGTWDPSVFSTLIGRNANKNAINYDLTQVTGVSKVSADEFPNANALIYAPAGATGKNVIVDGACSELVLQPGGTFKPKADFVAGSASVLLDERYDNWNLLTVPFNCSVPDGFLARRIDSHKTTTSGITSGAVEVTELEAGHTYLLINTGKPALQQTSSTSVVAAPAENADPALVGIYEATEVPAGGKVITVNDDGKPYFTKSPNGTVADALMGYFYDEAMKSTDFRAYPSTTLDPAYIDMAAAIRQLRQLYAEYKEIVTARANKAMTDSIANAEHRFSTMEFESASTTKAYTKALNAFAAEYVTMLIGGDDLELDMTSAISNPSFDESNTIAKGWTVEGKVSIRQNSNLTYATFGPTPATPNYLSADANTVVSQTVSNLKPGIYSLSAWVGAPEESTVITLTCGDKEVTANGHAFGKHYLTQVEITEIEVGEDGQLTISLTGNDQFTADEFKLTCLSMEADDDETGINQLPVTGTSHRSSTIYNLAGQRITNTSRPGIYIIGGKKVLK